MSSTSSVQEIIDFIEENSTCIMKINQNICSDYQELLFGQKNLRNINKMIQFYNRIFNEPLTCKIVIGAIPFEAVAFPSLIAFHNGFYKRPYTYIYKYLPHEMVHQCNGCKLKYVGPAKEWLRESLTEYIQLVIIKHILGEKFYNNQRDEYKKMDTISGNELKVNLYNFDNESHLSFLNPLIYGRGVLLFQKLINDDVNILKQLFSELMLLEEEISLLEFLNVLGGIIDIDIELVLNYIIKNEVLIE